MPTTTTGTFSQTIGDWYTGGGIAGQSVVKAMPYRNKTSGQDTTTGPFYLYGFNFALNKAKRVSSITLPNNTNVRILAMNLLP